MSRKSNAIRSISPATWLFLSLGLLVQIGVYIIAPHNPIALLSGMLGICSVVLGAQGNILTFVFGFAQVGTYTYLCCLEHFYAEIAINFYYFITMIYGVYCWRKRLDDNTLQVITRQLNPKLISIMILAIMALSSLAGWLLHLYSKLCAGCCL